MALIYGYCRCSTDEERQNIDRQIREVILLGVPNESYVYKEYESGTKTDRVELNRLLSIVKEGDTIISTEVSRLSRSTKQLCEIIEIAKDKKLKLVLGNFIVDCRNELDPMTEGMLKMMAVFSEMERNIISQRVKSGLDNAKAKGKKVGRPKTTLDKIPNIFLRYYPQYINGSINITELSRLCSISRQSCYKYISIIKGECN